MEFSKQYKLYQQLLSDAIRRLHPRSCQQTSILIDSTTVYLPGICMIQRNKKKWDLQNNFIALTISEPMIFIPLLIIIISTTGSMAPNKWR